MSDFIPGDPLRTVVNVVDQAIDKVKDSFDRTPDPPLDTVAFVDLKRYAGRWYELARLPLLFQKNSTVAIAEYTLNDDGSVGVHNSTHEGDRDGATIDGIATPADGAEESHARLKVQFGGIVKWVPVEDRGNYWILRLADDYSLALVGTADRDSLWLLARDPRSWGTPLAEEFLAWAGDNGFDLDKVIVDDWSVRRTRMYRAAPDGGSTPSR